MTHRAKLYSVKVHNAGATKQACFLGNVDGKGTRAASIVQEALQVLDATNTEHKIHISYESLMQPMDRDQVGATLLRGNSGVTSTITKNDNEVFRREPDHSESVRAGVLFELPKEEYEGVVALHIPHNMGYKSILEKELQRSFTKFGLVMTLKPIVPIAAFQEAVNSGHIKKLVLAKYNVSDSDPFTQYAKLDSGNTDRMKLVFEPKRRKFLSYDPLNRFVDDKTDENLRALLTFESLPFEEARVTAQLPDNTTRTFNIENIEGGHPMSICLDITESNNNRVASSLGVEKSALLQELKRVIKGCF